MFAAKIRKIQITGLTILIFFIAACSGSPQAAVGTEPVGYPTVYVTQFITPVVATSLPGTPTPAPTATPGVSSSTAWDPFSVPVYYPLIGCSASRLHVEDRAFVASAGGRIGIYTRKNLAFEPTLYIPPAGTELIIIDGPYCNASVIFWQVMTPDEEIQGYMPEGDGNTYWLLPLPPTVNP